MHIRLNNIGFTAALIALLIDEAVSLLCYECDNVLSANDCNTVAHCSANKVCFNERYLNNNGHVYRRLGCRDKNRCPGAIFGRRKRSTNEITLCERCCDSDFCQTKVCDDVDQKDRGPICYQCAMQSGQATCDRIQHCSRDDVCYESGSQTHNTQSRTTGCMPQANCHQVKSDLNKLNFTSANYTVEYVDGDGVKHTQNKCFDCCDTDACNTQCGGFHVPCADTTPLQTCQQIGQYVCGDKTKATNSGCLKFCGLCP